MAYASETADAMAPIPPCKIAVSVTAQGARIVTRKRSGFVFSTRPRPSSAIR